MEVATDNVGFALYRDENHTPDPDALIKHIKEVYAAGCDEIERMIELRKAETEGRLIVLPCKMGGVIYRAINIRPIKGDKPWKYIKQSRLTWNNLQETLRDFGKTVFLTREEAETALKGESNGLA